jgi:hypothetical protein
MYICARTHTHGVTRKKSSKGLRFVGLFGDQKAFPSPPYGGVRERRGKFGRARCRQVLGQHKDDARTFHNELIDGCEIFNRRMAA